MRTCKESLISLLEQIKDTDMSMTIAYKRGGGIAIRHVEFDIAWDLLTTRNRVAMVIKPSERNERPILLSNKCEWSKRDISIVLYLVSVEREVGRECWLREDVQSWINE